MKKIVAVVLALVMVLGLSTVAFAAAETKYEGLYYKTTTEAGVKADAAATDLEFYKAVAPKDTNKDGVLDEKGAVAYYKVTAYTSKACFAVDTLAEADVVIYTDAAAKNVFMYLALADYSVKYWPGVKTTNFGTACGQYTDAETAGYDDEASYYVYNKTLYVGVEDVATATEQLMVDGKLVPVTTAPVTLTLNAHKPVYTKDAKGEIASIKCSACGVVAAKAPNYASLPVGAVAVDQVNTLWYWTAATEAPEASDKVESAETFDAGIAMYVGMSVMAAAGSAVVLKKKD